MPLQQIGTTKTNHIIWAGTLAEMQAVVKPALEQCQVIGGDLHESNGANWNTISSGGVALNSSADPLESEIPYEDTIVIPGGTTSDILIPNLRKFNFATLNVTFAGADTLQPKLANTHGDTIYPTGALKKADGTTVATILVNGVYKVALDRCDALYLAKVGTAGICTIIVTAGI